MARFTGMFGATLSDLIRDMRDRHGEASLIQNLSHLQLGGVEIELIQPREGWPSIYGDGAPLAAACIGLHHTGFMADDDGAWDAAVGIMDESGAPLAMSVDLPHVRLRYYDSRPGLGHFTELVQRRPAMAPAP